MYFLWDKIEIVKTIVKYLDCCRLVAYDFAKFYYMYEKFRL